MNPLIKESRVEYRACLGVFSNQCEGGSCLLILTEAEMCHRLVGEEIGRQECLREVQVRSSFVCCSVAADTEMTRRILRSL